MDLALSDGSTSSGGSSLDESDADLEVFPLDFDEDATEDGGDQVHEVLDRAWGNKKSHFYGANEGSSSGDELEEIEAKELQQRMYSGMDEADFASHWFEDELKPSSNSLEPSAGTLAEETKRDLFKLFISFQEHVKWLLEFGIPAVKLYSCLPLLTAEGYKYLHCKVHILFSYCINILYCLQRERKAIDHPNMNRMAVLHKLLLQVSEIDHQLEAAIKSPLCPADLDSRVVSIVGDAAAKTGSRHSKQQKSRTSGSSATVPNDDPLEFYEKVKSGKLRKKSLCATRVQNVEDVDEEGKRAITFQMARNKGLTPNRKKEQRNPRVKHRNKYRKALIKRKSQVLPVVSELTQYGGEKSGIRLKLARSVTLK